MCAAGVLWGTGGLVVTALHHRDGMGALTVSAWRMAFAALALVAFTVAMRRSGAVLATMRQHPVAAVVVGCGTALYQALYFSSVLLVGVSVATVVALGLAPVLAAAAEHVITRTTPSVREVTVLVAALAGLGLVTSSAGHASGSGGDQPLLGLALAVASGATYAASTLLAHSIARNVEPIALTTCATTAGAVLLAPLLAVAALRHEPLFASDATSFGLLLYLGVFTMAVSYGLLYSGLRSTRGSVATVATLVEPVAAALLAALLLGERPGWLAVVGGVLILGAVVALRPSDERAQPL